MKTVVSKNQINSNNEPSFSDDESNLLHFYHKHLEIFEMSDYEDSFQDMNSIKSKSNEKLDNDKVEFSILM